MEKQYVHKQVVFNLANPQHRKILEWISTESSNISGFIFQSLVMRYEKTNDYQPKEKKIEPIEEEVSLSSWFGEE